MVVAMLDEPSVRFPQPGILTFQYPHLSTYGITDGITLKAFLTGLKEVLQPSIVDAGVDALSAAAVLGGDVAPKALENNTELLFSGELALGNALDVPDESLCLFALGFSL